MTISWS